MSTVLAPKLQMTFQCGVMVTTPFFVWVFSGNAGFLLKTCTFGELTTLECLCVSLEHFLSFILIGVLCLSVKFGSS